MTDAGRPPSSTDELRGLGELIAGWASEQLLENPAVLSLEHDPTERRYGGVGWRCSTGVRLTPHGGAQIEIYVSHIRQMPAIFEQVKQLLVNAQQPSRK